MRKFLLLIAAVLFSLGTYAQKVLWNSSIDDVSAGEKFNVKSPAAMDMDGNLYVTGTQREAFEFAGNEAAVLGVGAYIAKYNAEGAEQYVINLHGSIDITAITTDAEKNLYIAGINEGMSYITGVEGVEGEYEKIGNDGEKGAFMAKYDANGNLLAVKTYKAVLESLIDFGDGYIVYGDNMDFYIGALPTLSISKILVEGSKVYAQFDYTGDVTVNSDLKLTAKLLFVMGFAYKDAMSSSVLVFDTMLENPSNVATLAVADVAPDGSVADVSATHDFEFVVEGEDVYVAAFAAGNVVLTTSAGNEAFDFVTDDNSPHIEEGAIIANVGKKTVKLSNELREGDHTFYNTIVGMEVKNGKIYLAGTFNNTCAFDNSKEAVGASDVFVASIYANELIVDGVYTNANDEGATNKYCEKVSGVVFGNESVYVISGVVDMNGEAETVYNNYNVAYDGTVNVATEALSATTVAYNDNAMALINCTGKTAVSVYSKYEFTSIESVAVETENTVIYDLTGRRIEKITNAGIYIVNGNKVLVK